MKIGILEGVIAIAGAAFLISLTPVKPVTPDAKKPDPINAARMTAAVAAIPQMPNWRSVTVDKIEPHSVTATLTFRTNVDQDQAEVGSRVVVRAIIAEILAQGGNPRTDSDFIGVSAQQDGLRGETGVPLFRLFGSSYYDRNRDSIVYKPW